MNIFVWRGDRVLKNYRSGLVVVVATDEAAAWQQVKKADFNAWARLTYNISWVYEETDLEFVDPDDIADWVPPKPEVFTLETLPALIMYGGE